MLEDLVDDFIDWNLEKTADGARIWASKKSLPRQKSEFRQLLDQFLIRKTDEFSGEKINQIDANKYQNEPGDLLDDSIDWNLEKNRRWGSDFSAEKVTSPSKASHLEIWNFETWVQNG